MDRYQYCESDLKLIEESSIPCAVYQFLDKRVITIALSMGFLELFGMEDREGAYDLMDNDMYRDVYPDDVAEIADAAIEFAVNGGKYDVLYRTKVAGEYIVVHAIGKHIYKPEGVRLAVINYMYEGVYKREHSSKKILDYNDLFKKKDLDRRISYDFLTGLPDMNYFFELASAYRERAILENKTSVMMFMDLSGMQAFNQRYGYTEGDRLIKAVAKTLVKHFSNENCCRVTADHFAVYTHVEDFEKRIESLIDDFKNLNDKRTLPVRIGVYKSSMGNVISTTACDRAKIACDSCGHIFASTVAYFDESMLKKFENRHYVFDNIDKAIEEGWIKVYYQPIVRTSNGRVCDEEALVRWEDPERGIMMPSEFIPILEDARIAYKLDLNVVEQVLAKLKKQEEGGLFVVPNSVNFSRTDFHCCDMVEELRKRVDDSGIDRSKIIVEITESVIMDDLDFMMSQIERFHRLGFSVWMDDFGSGYSSPDILQRIHFDVVKIDKLFVDMIEESEGSRVIITELIRLANGLGSETVVEGVETSEQVEFLKEIGCTRLQGYFYCNAIPLSEIFDRNRKGIQIGFENPSESDYYTALGNVSLYDMSFSAEDDDENLRDYFDTMPMFIVEASDDEIRLIRGNKSFREFMMRFYPQLYGAGKVEYTNVINGISREFADALLKCREDGKRVVIDVRTVNKDVVHLFIRKIATNPTTGVVALAIVILGYVNNDAELKHREALERIKQERKAYARVTALSGDYICIYSVNPENDNYLQFSVAEMYESLGAKAEGENFFEDALEAGIRTTYHEDMELYLSHFSKEKVLKAIEEDGVFSLNYRLVINGLPRYVCLKAAIIQEEDGPQIIVGVVDIDAQMKKDQEFSRKLTAARDMANLDTLTGVKNKHAYVAIEKKLDADIKEGKAEPFAVVVFDLNGLKAINDTYGHQAGDRFIREGCDYICGIFQHSPVYRVGGDEFVVIAQGHDYRRINSLMKAFADLNIQNIREKKMVIAAGVSRHHDGESVATVFERADSKMYENKKYLKSL